MKEKKPDRSDQMIPMAVIGVSALFPGSVSTTGFWRDILAGADLITDVPATHWLPEDYYDPDPSTPDKTYARRGAFLSPVDFDTLGFGIPPANVSATDTSQLLALIVAQRVLEDACGGELDRVDRSRTSVILGATSAQELYGHMVSRLQRPVWVKALREVGLGEDEVQAACDRISDHYVPWQESTFPGLLGNVVAGRIANRLDLGGTNCVTDAACASSFSAVSMAVNELSLGHSDVVIVGGVDTMNDPLMFMCFAKTPALSESGDCRPFSDRADGTMLGEGLGMVALKRLPDAERDGDRIYAVLRGLGTSSDGRSKSVYAPVAAGQASALRRAYGMAGYGPDTVELVEAHGTGTRAGDAAEFEGLASVFSEAGREERQYCALGSIKSQIGHTKAASGAAGLFKVVMALRHGVLPPTLKVDRPNPELAMESSPFYLNTRARPWIRSPHHPRRAGVSSFGFGGSNFHLTLEEYQGPAPRAARMRTADHELVLLGADGADQLLEQLRDCVEAAATPGVLRVLARSSQDSFRSDARFRLAVVAESEERLRSRLQTAAKRIADQPEQAFSTPRGISYGHGGRQGKVAFLFPGQGSQYLEMGAPLAMHFDAAREVWDQAAAVPLSPDLTLQEVVFPKPVFCDEHREAQMRRLTATEWAQPAIGCVSLSMLEMLARLGLSADCVGGHSFGDVTALHVAGVLSSADLLQVARIRGEVMAAAATRPGSMAAVALPVEELRGLLEEIDAEVVIANHNAPTQVVISGATEAIEAAERQLAERGVTAKRLPVATAFHSQIVEASCGPFLERLNLVDFAAPRMPAFANATAEPYPGEPEAVRCALAEQIARPVRFVEQVQAMYDLGVRTFIEVGPSSVLSSLVGQILDGLDHLAVSLDRKREHTLSSFFGGLGRLAAAGFEMDFAALWNGERLETDPRVKSASATSILLSGANHGRPYPPPGGAADLPEPNPTRRRSASSPQEPSSETKMSDEQRRTAAGDRWLEAFREAQERTAEAHTAFQRSMAEAHTAFLRTAEAGFASLGRLAGADVGELALDHLPTVDMVSPVARAFEPEPEPEPVAEPDGAQASDPAAPTIESLLLGVVAEKTGYPAEMLKLEMDLEGDLGIDSIKRVEILSAMVDRAPNLPEVEASEMVGLETLAQIVTYLGGVPAAGPDPVSEAGPFSIESLLLEVVAEKTGYPAEMLKLEMDLEGDLGIDSIKRVEILSAMVERVPELPEVEASEMVSLQTLSQVAEYLGSTPANEGRQGLPVAASPEILSTVGRYVLEVVDAPALGMAQPGLLRGGRIAVTDDRTGVASALVEILGRRGVEAEVVTAVPERASGVIVLDGLAKATTVDMALDAARRAFRAARSFAGGGALFVTVQDTGGHFAVHGCDEVEAYLGALSGLAKTAAQEWPEVSVKAIDLERGGRGPHEVAAVLAGELFSGGPELEVGLAADGRRVTLRSPRADLAAGRPRLRQNAVLVVSGGARGVTVAALGAMAAEIKPRLLLLGRTQLSIEPEALSQAVEDAEIKRVLMELAAAEGEQVSPAEIGRRAHQVKAVREVHSSLETLAAAGAEVRYAEVDVCNRRAVAEEVAKVRERWGRIDGVIHAAGVIADRLIAEKSDVEFERVFTTKVEGLRSLLAATVTDDLQLLVMFSSVAARSGNAGQVDYAMANEVLNKVAVAEHQRRGDACVVKSLGWGPWDGGMVTAQLRDRFTSLGVPLVGLERGPQMMLDELWSGSAAQVEVVLGAKPMPTALLSDGSPRDFAVDLMVDSTSHPYLEAHAIDGTPVVPVVLAVEWFARAARALRPDLQLACLHDLRVLKGIRLDGFKRGGDRLLLRGRHELHGDSVSLQMQVLGIDDTRFYTATARMVTERERPTSEMPLLSLEDWNGRQLYGGVLFHGPEFQVIRDIEGISDEGISGTVAGMRERRWSTETWRTDAACFDGGLQMALLWSERVLGGPSLPTAIDEVLTWTDELSTGPVRCVLKGREASNGRTVSDVLFQNASGQLVAELRGVQTHVRPTA